jgi:ABC-type bacteriocin/lantibiotic exporter with double-glycine peptidase domain
MLKDFITGVKYSKAYRKKQLAIILIFTLLTLSAAAIPFTLRDMIDNIQKGIISSALVIQSFIILCALIINRILGFAIDYSFSTLSNSISSDKRAELLDTIFTSSINRNKTLDDSVISNRLLNEIYCYGNLIGVFPTSVITNIIRVVFAVIVLTNINIYLFFINFLAIPIIIILVNIMKDKAERAVYSHRKQYEAMQKLIKELLAAHIDIKQMKSETQIMEIFSDKNKLYLKAENYLQKIVKMTQESSGILFSTLPIFSLLGGVALTAINKCDIGSAVAFYMYVIFFITPIVNFTDMKINNIQNRKKEEMIHEIVNSLNFENGLDTEPCWFFNTIYKTRGILRTVNGSCLKEPELSNSHNIKNIHIDFKCEEITINKIIFKYNNGGIVEFYKKLYFNKHGLYYMTADSGFGKTTILKLLSKILVSKESKIIFDNIDINDIAEDVFFDKVTYLNGAPSFIQGSIENNITYFGKYNFDNKYIKFLFEDDECIFEEKELNIGEGDSLSTGQLQRINILRLFAKGVKQRLIILDEALSGVEENKERTILELLKISFPEAIIIVVTHRKSSKALCDYIIEL